MEECTRENHFYESGPASGVFVYIVDDDDPVFLKFSSRVRIKVLFDSYDALDKKNWTSFDQINRSDIQITCPDILPSENDKLDSATVVNEFEISDSQRTQSVEDHNTSPGKESSTDNSEKKHHSKTGTSNAFSLKSKRNLSGKKRLRSYNLDRTDEDINEEQLLLECDPESNKGKNKNSSNLSPESESYSSRKRRGKSNTVQEKLRVKLKKGIKTAKNVTALPKQKALKRAGRPKASGLGRNTSPSVTTVSEKIKSQEEKSVDKVRQVGEKQRKLLVEKVVKCEYCEAEFKNKQEYYNHRRAEETVNTCGICGKVEPYEAHLIVHMQKHRRVHVDSASNGSEKSQDSELAQESLEGKGSAKKKSKKERMKCNVCGLVVSSIDSLKIHTMLHTNECAYRCCVCGEKFPSLSTRQHHIVSHMSAQRYKCNPCGQRFVTRAELAKHQLTHEIKCALCGEIFPNKTSRTCHFRVAHPNDILKCNLCSNLFATEEDLKKHLVYHKKGKKEQCPVCGVVVSKIKDHMLLHSQPAQEKMYVCDQCPMRYLRKSNLDRHMRTHTGEKPYACNRCPKHFRSNGMLRKHLLIHTQERPYQCEVCGKRCSLRSNLNIHMRLHNSDRHYPCTLCPQGFNHKNSLQFHMRNKHARELNQHEMQPMDIPSNPPPPNILPNMENAMPIDPNNRQLQLNMQVGPATDMGSEIAMKGDNLQTFSPMHMQMVYPANIPTNMQPNMLDESNRISLMKYDLQPPTSHMQQQASHTHMQPQTSHGHGY